MAESTMAEKAKNYHVRDLVIDDEYDIIPIDATIVDAAKKMREKAIPDLVVLDQSGKVAGVVADFDIVQNVVADGKNPSEEKVTTAMYKIEPVHLDTPVLEALERMQKLHVNVVPVIEKDKLKGVCSLSDCYNFTPSQNPDEVGLIPVKNPRNAEFWLASISAIFAFVMGILLPLAGVFSFFTGEPEDMTSFFRMIDIRGGVIRFYLFEAHGTEFYDSYFDLVNVLGGWWVVVIIVSFLVIIFGILGTFSLFYASYSDLHNIRTSNLVRTIFPLSAIGALVLQWIVFGIALANAPVKVSGLGLAWSIISMILLLIATFRDYVFKQVVKE
jgi:CBS domain-containing protein